MLKEKLMSDLKESMSNKDTIRKNTIQSIRAEILNWEKDSKNIGKDTTDDTIISIIQKEVKKRKDALEQFQKAERNDLCEISQIEIQTLESYLPAQLSDEELKSKVQTIIDNSEVKAIGPIMKAAKEQIGSQADGKRIVDIVKQLINN